MFWLGGVPCTGTIVSDGFPLGLVGFEDTSHVAVGLLCMQEVWFDTSFVLCLVSGYEVVPPLHCVLEINIRYFCSLKFCFKKWFDTLKVSCIVFCN